MNHYKYPNYNSKYHRYYETNYIFIQNNMSNYNLYSTGNVGQVT
jgi:hypothetical protein